MTRITYTPRAQRAHELRTARALAAIPTTPYLPRLAHALAAGALAGLVLAMVAL